MAEVGFSIADGRFWIECRGSSRMWKAQSVMLTPQSPFDFAHGPEPVEGREKHLLLCEVVV
jgi:hypothetical protein